MTIPQRHLSNSAAVWQHPAAWNAEWCNGVRPGRHIRSGWPLGYGVARRAEADCTIAVVPVGYHDGFPRALADRAEVLVGARVPHRFVDSTP